MMKTNRTYRRIASFLLTGLGVASLALSCAKIESGIGQEGAELPVAFSTYARQSTKADASYVAPGADFVAGAQIGVFGFYHDGTDTTDGSWEADGTDNIPDYMYNQLVTKQNDDSWTYSPVKYWPNEVRSDGNGATSAHADKLSFWGYYPRIAEANYIADTPMYSGTDAKLRFWQAGGTTTPYSNTTAGLPAVTFTQSEYQDKMVDLMFSAPLYDLTKPSVSGKVHFNFRHALARITFKAKCPRDASASIQSVKVLNAATRGQYDVESNTWTDPQSRTDFTLTLRPSASSLTDEETVITDDLLMIPQSLTDVTASITYTIVGTLHSITQTFSVPLSSSGLSEWNTNTSVTYVLNIGANAITYSATLSDWDNVSEIITIGD